MSTLTFDELREANQKRLKEQVENNKAFAKCKDWNPHDWAVALMGELGELCNYLKKLKRGDFKQSEVVGAIEDELADIQAYLDLLSENLNVDLGQATINKFNRVSRRPEVSSDVLLLGEAKRNCPYGGCPNPYNAKPPCALCYE